ETSGRMRHQDVGGQWGVSSRERIRIVDGVSGCVLLVRREVFERIGLLDERYFFSFEDLDFCLRARRAGYTSVIDSHSVAYHEGGASIRGRSARRIYFATRNHLLLSRQLPMRGGPWGTVLRQLSVLSLNVAFALTNGEIPRAMGLGAVTRGVWDHVLRRYGA